MGATASALRLRGVLVLVVGLACAAHGGQPLGRWAKLPLPSKTSRGFWDMGVEPDGTLWVMADGGLFRWDGKAFVPPKTAKLRAIYYHDQLFGGGDRPLYATQRGGEAGSLHRIGGGDAQLVTDFRSDSVSDYPSVYVARSGALCNWGKDSLAVYAKGEWQRIEAALSRRRTVILDAGDAVRFFYRGGLYTYDGELSESMRVAAVLAEEGPTLGALLGKDVLVTASPGAKGLRAHRLPVLTPVTLGAALDAVEIHDLVRGADGSVLVYAADAAGEGRVFHRVAADGTAERLAATAGIEWEPARASAYPHSVLSASDGSLWLGLPRAGVARLRDGKLRLFTWLDGLACGTSRHLAEGQGGRIYAAGRRALYEFRPDEPAAPPPSGRELWQTFELASAYPIRDSAGNLWLLLRDRPGELSRWDGRAWRHTKVPFDTGKVLHALADDRGRVFFVLKGESYTVGPAGVERHESMRAMLEWALVDGAERFSVGPSLQGCVVLDGGRVWYGTRSSRTAYHFDGATWKTVRFVYAIYGIVESLEYDALFRTNNRYYTVVGGYPRAVAASRRSRSRWLLGPRGYQPFDEELFALHPRDYVAVEIDTDGRERVLAPQGERGVAGWRLGSTLPSSVRWVTPGLHGGHWSAQTTGGSAPRRILGSRVIACDFTDTPLAGWTYAVQRVLEDRARNLWFDLGTERGVPRVVRKRLSGFRLALGAVPDEAVRTLDLTAEPELPGLTPDAMRVFWRFRDGQWQGGASGSEVTVAFPAGGDYVIELAGMDRQGGLSETAVIAVRARVPTPDTVLTAEAPFRITDILWRVPVKLVPSSPEAEPLLLYRIDGGSWRSARSRKYIGMWTLAPGPHVVELAARESRVYRDPTPVRIAVIYSPDPEGIVSRRLKLLASSESKAVARAMADIALAGPRVLPVVQRHLAKAEKGSALAARLASLLARLRRKYEPKPKTEPKPETGTRP